VQKIAEIIASDRRASPRLIEELSEIPKTIVHRIMTEDLGKRKVCARFVPHALPGVEKLVRVEHYKDMLKAAQSYAY
jgi:hypothetical protein